MSAFVDAWLPISDFQAGLIIGAAVTMAVVALGEIVRVALARRAHPKLRLTHDPFAVSNPHERHQVAYLHFSIRNAGRGSAHDWRVRITSEDARITIKPDSGRPGTGTATQSGSEGRSEVLVSSGEGDVIQPSADQPMPTLRAEVPADGHLKARYVLHTGPLVWEGTITVAHEAVHRASVAITQVRTVPRREA